MFTICSRPRNRKRNRKLQIRNQNQPLTDDLVRLLPKAELLAREIFYTMKEARTLIEWWRSHFNTFRPHSSLGYRPPAPKAILPNYYLSLYPEAVAA
jgi:transposase InsO family protein